MIATRMRYKISFSRVKEKAEEERKKYIYTYKDSRRKPGA